MTRERLASLLLLTAVVSLAARTAAGQVPATLPRQPYRAFPSLDLEGGVARNFERGRWGLLGGVAGGVGLFDGDHIWDFVAGIRGVRGDRRAVTVSAARMTVENGLGLHATMLWDLDRRAAGAGLGLSISLLNLQGDIVLDGARTTTASLFISVPVGLLAYLLLERRERR